MSLTFLDPNWLWALLVVPVVAVALWRWGRDRRRAASAFADPAVMPVGAGRRARALRATAAVLALVAVACGPVAMARPALDHTTEKQRGSVMLAIDSSKSMLKTDLQPSRLEAAKEAANRFLDEAPRETAIGLIDFSDGARVVVPAVTDRDQVRRALDTLTIREGTAIGDAVVAGIGGLRAAGALEPPLPADARDARGRILLLTDGANSVGLDPAIAAERAKAVKVPVYTVLLGDDPGRADQASPRETLASLATQTGGVFTQSTSTEDLVRVFEDLGGAIVPVRELTELTAWVALLALVLLAAAGVLVGVARDSRSPAARAAFGSR